MGATSRTTLGPKFTEGARLLWLTSGRMGHTQEDIRRTVGCSRGLVHRWLFGDKGIDLAYAFRVEDVYGIPARAWLSKPARRFSLPRPRASAAA